ncbi:rolling circle replication-associated protein [Paracidovorax valerianellae]|uniref:Replication-associated protein ORF2/G2P domain-containing protein n=1 Tax=Paracidovorax valerianellae TaxID=187868 RepID=A0A1G7EGP3_9BURK|nr:hypothetical protein [Paracidovorax valerianellae]MDA8446351.1 hypothetical protein [Paracidovorax valerianellae]SDE62814.1 hypothetical protein SAMN05192589_12318 [Paracidovorax valerianellae]
MSAVVDFAELHRCIGGKTSRMVAADAVLRARSAVEFAALADRQEARSASGLVSDSTTCTGLFSAVDWAHNCITIDPKKTRVTRLRKGLGIAAKQLHNLGPRNQQIWMQTLTYAGTNLNWRPEHISRYLDAMRRWHYARTGTKTLRYAWVAELQQRGVIHYHVICWLAAGLTPPKGDMQWSSIDRKGVKQWHPPMWPHGMTRRDRSTAPVAYLMKYASKVDSKNVGSFPHGARIHGTGGLDAVGRSIRRWVLWPAYVQGNASIADPFKPSPGGGYLNAQTGEYLPSEFAPTGGGFTRFVRIRTVPRQVDAAGPFSWLNQHQNTAASGPAAYLQ